jgi:polyhydroxyalkanoate synthesis regulator phasin
MGKKKVALSNSFVENHKDVNESQALALIYDCEKQIAATKEEQSEDEQLKTAKEIVSDLNSGYKSVIDYERAKINFLMDKIENLRRQVT